MRSGEIKALSGLRIVAAVWVVLFHFRPLLHQAAPRTAEALAPVLDCGAQGVDLFFILSGFVLTWNYLDRMGPAWSTRTTLRFLWLRLARVWPVYLVTMHLAAGIILATRYIGHVPWDEALAEVTAGNYMRQLLLIQLWFRPYFDGSSWNGPAWSISAEWLAYLLFGGLVLLVFRLMRATRARGLLLLSVGATLPPLMLVLSSGLFYTPWSWLPRIVLQFTAGALACAAVRRLRPSDRMRLGAGYLALGLLVAVIALLYWLDAHGPAAMVDPGALVDVLFVPLVVSLAVGAGGLVRVLSWRAVVYAGHVSFSLYMVHELVHMVWNWAAEQFGIVLEPGTGARLVVAGLLGAAAVGAVALYHLVEEPSRKWMRRMLDTPPAADGDGRTDTRVAVGGGAAAA
ncbi:acyltransferase [uncultured Mycolicibacterium sp.]|uniref:acyltransferase family protein n=1 Tax=uncultured Mycolicibacterium sp. TaxID=2320817 RepID=UPI002624B02F|nr:acyltransferase [uncultured Mycolicibacterium sp.]